MTDEPSGKPGLRPISRRSFMASVAGGATLLGLSGCATTGAVYTGVTDNDGGLYADAAGYGVRGGYRACTDSDVGSYADPVNQGRSCQHQSGITDNDTGPYADPIGNGRGGRPQTGYTDNDTGPYADPVGGGRGGPRACSDSDRGPYADPAYQGRRC
ncbi:MAG: hypothetical protein ACK4NO_01490 [Glycocaulis sp.]